MFGCLLVHRFPVACELAERPQLRGLPLAVSTPEGRVWEASSEALRLGVAAGQRLSEAMGHWPGLAVLDDRPSLYRERAEAILDTLAQVAFTLEAADPGQVYFDFEEIVPFYPMRAAAAGAVAACAPLSLQPRLGVAPSRFGALAAALEAAPGDWREVGAEELPGFLAGQPVEALPLSAETLRRLRLLGLDRLGRLAALARSKLEAQFGREGRRAWEMATGRDTATLRRRPHQERVRATLSLDTPLVTRQ